MGTMECVTAVYLIIATSLRLFSRVHSNHTVQFLVFQDVIAGMYKCFILYQYTTNSLARMYEDDVHYVFDHAFLPPLPFFFFT